jgi:hypothetical protein
MRSAAAMAPVATDPHPPCAMSLSAQGPARDAARETMGPKYSGRWADGGEIEAPPRCGQNLVDLLDAWQAVAPQTMFGNAICGRRGESVARGRRRHGPRGGPWPPPSRTSRSRAGVPAGTHSVYVCLTAPP